jgi:hypothetical protein
LIEERLEIYQAKMLLIPREVEISEQTKEKVETVQFSFKEKSKASKYFARDEWLELEDLF